jgi:Zn-dependent protease
MVVVPILSFLLGGWMVGWASAPYNRQWAIQYPRRAALMSLAGPVSNLLLLLGAALLIRLGIACHVFEAPARVWASNMAEPAAPGIYLFLAKMLSIMFSLNLLLCTFNMLPFPPLDGSGLLFFFTSPASAEALSGFLRQPAMNSIGLLISWKLFGAVFPGVQLFAANLLYPGAAYH